MIVYISRNLSERIKELGIKFSNKYLRYYDSRGRIILPNDDRKSPLSPAPSNQYFLEYLHEHYDIDIEIEVFRKTKEYLAVVYVGEEIYILDTHKSRWEALESGFWKALDEIEMKDLKALILK